MRADPKWLAARAIPRTHKAERAAAFAALRKTHGLSDYASQAVAKDLRTGWLAEHIEAVLAQTLATRAYRAVQRVALGQAKKVRFMSRGRGLGSIENKRNDTGLRFAFCKAPTPGLLSDQPDAGRASKTGSRTSQKREIRAQHHQLRQEQRRGGKRAPGYVYWQDMALCVHIDWNDPVIAHALAQRIKYVRLLQHRASSPRAKAADALRYCYAVQIVVEGVPLHKPKHMVGTDIVGADLGPSAIAAVPCSKSPRAPPS